ncbi:MAG: GTP 3',8-cyclase MoaA [Geobacteraceae bacterium]|nr:GTP 3',8-cyclase MoaA [Geobacteraceae bacterium]
MPLVDSFGRKINYLRLSITDRCNFRCLYCMPEDGVNKVCHHEILSYEELLLLARTVVPLGIEKIRVTGGEPLVRTGVVPFLKELSQLPGLRQLVLTTNASLLEDMATQLKDAGVQRLNISLDSLCPDNFAAITRGGDLAKVLAGIRRANEIGFPVKINVVAMRGVNDHEFLDFAALTIEKPFAIRFIEYMPTRKDESWESRVISGEEILQRIAERYPLQPVVRGEMAGPSRDYKIDGALGTVGVITPVSGHFCHDCNRIRVTSQGMVKNCLFADTEVDLKPYLRAGDVTALQEMLKKIVTDKPGKYLISDKESSHQPFSMSKVGG